MYKRPALLLFTAMATAALVAACGKPPEPLAASAAHPDAGPDGRVSEQVRAALRRSDALQGHDIAVSALKGDVKLTGTLDNQAQIDAAVQLARATEGAHTVHNHLVIKP